jgi:hypothetical protein
VCFSELQSEEISGGAVLFAVPSVMYMVSINPIIQSIPRLIVTTLNRDNMNSTDRLNFLKLNSKIQLLSQRKDSFTKNNQMLLSKIIRVYPEDLCG